MVQAVVDLRATTSLVKNLSPVDTNLVRLLLGDGADLSFLGDPMEDHLARAVASGELNPRTMMPYDIPSVPKALEEGDGRAREEILRQDFWSMENKTRDEAKINPHRRKAYAAAQMQVLDKLKSRRAELLEHGCSVESLQKRRKLTADTAADYSAVSPSDPVIRSEPLACESPPMSRYSSVAEVEYLPRYSLLRLDVLRDESYWDRMLITGNGSSRAFYSKLTPT